jgi:hypothetical protein
VNSEYTSVIVGVLGPAISAAEHMEAMGALDRVTCTEHARQLYVSTSYQFTAVHLPGTAEGSPASANVMHTAQSLSSSPGNSTAGVRDITGVMTEVEPEETGYVVTRSPSNAAEEAKSDVVCSAVSVVGYDVTTGFPHH